MPCLIILFIIVLIVLLFPVVGIGLTGLVALGLYDLSQSPYVYIWLIMIVSVIVLWFGIRHTIAAQKKEDRDLEERERKYKEQKPQDSGNT